MTGTSFTTWGLIVAEKTGSRKKESEARMARKLGRDSNGEVFQNTRGGGRPAWKETGDEGEVRVE
jgi:hypothetical protein